MELYDDIFSRRQSKRLFAFIAAGGTAGAICGPIITTTLVKTVGLGSLLLISATVLSSSVICIRWLTMWDNQDFSGDPLQKLGKNAPLEGGVVDAFKLIIKSPYLIGICLFITLYAVSITFVEIQQAEMIEASFNDPAQRTKLFSSVDLAVNVLALVFQLFVTSRLIQWFGFRMALMFLPVGITIGFGLIATTPLLVVMITIDIFRRSGDYSIMKPAREMLFSVISREEKYKAKNFIDTAILRGGNATSALAYTAVKTAGVTAAGIAAISFALGLAWCATAFWLAEQFNRKQKELAEAKVS